jgi:hypothetical protein
LSASGSFRQKIRYHIISRVNLETFAEVSKHPWSIVFELEIVLHARCKFVSSTEYANVRLKIYITSIKWV